jgi:hypothetical protein
MANSSKNQLFAKRGNGHFYAAHWLNPIKFGQLLIQETVGREREKVVELITRWVLRDSFFIVIAGDWFVDHDDVRYALFRFTNSFDEILDRRLRLVRARTCFQLLDLLTETYKENQPVLILDPLHHFYNRDIDLSTRNRIFEQCCQYIKRLSLSNPTALLVPKLDIEDHKRYFPILAAVADEIIPVEEAIEQEPLQGSLF